MTVSSVKTGELSLSFALNNNYMEPIATTLVGSGGVNQVTFNDIPQTYKHLQVRAFAQTNRATYGRDLVKLTVNSDTGNNYSWHELVGDGTTANAAADSSTNIILKIAEIGTSTGGAFGAFICDVLDYANINKYKTFRSLFGGDHNGLVAGLGGTVGLDSGLWQNTNAITSLKFIPNAGSAFNQHSRFSLYGIKG